MMLREQGMYMRGRVKSKIGVWDGNKVGFASYWKRECRVGGELFVPEWVWMGKERQVPRRE